MSCRKSVNRKSTRSCTRKRRTKREYQRKKPEVRQAITGEPGRRGKPTHGSEHANAPHAARHRIIRQKKQRPLADSLQEVKIEKWCWLFAQTELTKVLSNLNSTPKEGEGYQSSLNAVSLSVIPASVIVPWV